MPLRPLAGRAALKAQTWRHHILQRGDIQIIGYRVCQGIAMGFIVGTCYFQRGNSSINDGVQVGAAPAGRRAVAAMLANGYRA